MPRLLFFVALFVGLVGLQLGCGPVQYISSIMEASEAEQSAKSAKAWEWACFEYYAAQTYMRKAVEEAGHSDFEAAAQFAAQAATYAKAAKRLAEMRQTQQKKPPVMCERAKIMEKRYMKEKSAPGNNYLRKRIVE
ncbi:MAG: hypothetical protein H6727_09070 [Myxococcales bacterium]|nr:hypothetical protein [Myxococcales bacterium]